jgi:hypothetical protein
MNNPSKQKVTKTSRLKAISGLVGVILTIIGWTISNAEHFVLIKKVIAPKYDIAMATWRNMTKKDFVLGPGDKGFSEMKDLFNHAKRTLTSVEGQQLSDEWLQIKRLDNWDITQFKTLDSRVSMVEAKPHPVKAITLEIQASNFHIVTMSSLHSVEEGVESFYLKTPIFKAGAYIFWLGVTTSFASLFLKSGDGK